MSENRWVVGWGNGVSGPTTPSIDGPTVAGRQWEFGIVTMGIETIAIFPNQVDRTTGEQIHGSGDETAAIVVRAVNGRADLIAALQECEDYFDNRADADCDQDGYIPNEEMKLLQVVREALKKAGA
ncbi:hypothetical protein [Sinorhizobium sp. 22678]|uniref:hypothetical protein n=1 Tax=Sinorhizobium sp. 22678 TaxID=3453955 RepID=UPI003F850C36